MVPPDPPPGIILPPEGTPLAVGTPFPTHETDIKPVDGFAPARGGTQTSVGAGGSFEG